ncbi:MAG: ATP-dependent DNA helicase RecG [Spirochaetaceae bacterium]|jgi:ATP-dependent DNA helicase RecG|nr:ATP-dependent DNA helicase RecG [Spirochaetaceae bacterium]
MFVRELNIPVRSIKGIGERKALKLCEAGIIDIAAVLTRFPKDYEDRSRSVPLIDYNKQRNICTVAQVIAHSTFRFKGELRTKIVIEDETARAVIPCFFKGDYLAKKLVVGDEYRISGHFERNKYGELQSTRIDFEEASITGASSKFGGILPVYYYSDNERNKLLRGTVLSALTLYANNIEDELPQEIIKSEALFSKSRALYALHFPQSMTELETARKTLVFEELFFLEIIVGRRRRRGAAPAQEYSASTTRTLQKKLESRLPFALTNGQRKAIDEINADIGCAVPMARLLQGDVGSGKTLVAFFAALAVIETGAQAALMAPTELLARQHAETAANLLEPLGLRVAFLTGNIKQTGRKPLLTALKNGEIDFIIGTHALFSRDVTYKKLALAIIDEQHRFGVTQRESILAKGNGVSLLMMSATPIPRTLAMTIFGDMDVSVIHDMPPGRKPVITHLARGENEMRVYEFVRDELNAGRQAYFVYPLIEQNDELALKDAESMQKRLSNEIFPQFSSELLHSRINEEEKRAIMRRFRLGETKILVATSVVEVGVDVPNASCMVIEHAERFGLSALHQLRGRVGRGTHQSYCFLIYAQKESIELAGTYAELLTNEERSREGKRLMVMLNETDGFAIAEEDLKFRGYGEITGTEQSGFMRLGIADPLRDLAALERARKLAFAILDEDPSLSLPQNSVIARVLQRSPPFLTA